MKEGASRRRFEISVKPARVVEVELPESLSTPRSGSPSPHSTVLSESRTIHRFNSSLTKGRASEGRVRRHVFDAIAIEGGPDLNLVKGWKLADFIATMRTGIDPNGHTLSEQMPWRPLGRMDDDELARRL